MRRPFGLISDVGDDVVSVPEVRSGDAVGSGEVGAWSWDQRGDARHVTEAAGHKRRRARAPALDDRVRV